MANKPQKPTFKEYIIAAIAVIAVGVIFFLTCGDSGSGSSGKKWSDLNEREKENARWAYHAQQAIDDYEK